jgi:branched-chain amino acid aminotransferase
MFISLNNQIVPVAEAKLHVSDLAVQRGYGIFDYFKVVDGHAYFLDHYLDRFFHSAAVMRLPMPLTREELRNAIYTLIGKNNLAESGIKMILTGGYSPDGYQPTAPNLILSQHPLVLPTQSVIEAGVKIITHEYVRDIPEVKTINYTMGIWLLDKIASEQAADVLYVKDGLVSEFPRSNFFIVTRENVVLTASANVLKGVTRKNILDLAGKTFKSQEVNVTLNDVHQAKEAFITSTTKRIIPVIRVNDTTIGDGRPGEVSMALLQQLIDLEKADRLGSGF